MLKITGLFILKAVYFLFINKNGGQYTHAAIWVAMAFSKLGDNKKAWEIFNMINPANHARSSEEVAVYKVEPYVVATIEPCIPSDWDSY